MSLTGSVLSENQHLDLCDITQLPEFVREREKLIRKRLLELLGRK
jgi:hypothetical protein